jgi:hypothetical protein
LGWGGNHPPVPASKEREDVLAPNDLFTIVGAK